MQLGISLEPPFPTDDGSLGLRTALAAERLGFDYALVSGHVLANANGSAADPLILLSAVAGATQRIRLATSVLVAPYYDPVVLANQAATLDIASGQRFTLAVGTGWNPQEFGAVGVPVGQRGSRTDEHLRVIKELWSGAPVDFDGRYTTLRQAALGVTPRTPGGPPLWVGGHSDAALRRALLLADGWHGSGVDAAGVLDVRRRLTALGEELGRDAAALDLTTVCFLVPPGFRQTRDLPGRPLGGPAPTADSILEELTGLEAAGISLCSLWMPVEARATEEALEWIAEEVLRKIR
ncbi:TIGR03619 family F420-dependent LLM class oxidoreductase [Streptomyces sp. NPDC059582]|uniref:TIGR03619 family F420-dependent LLM class oxidoreductase n=1 Tax=Streptomyces sp. NPDC059582 TaxID=3346875 RepID=UPI0036A6F0E1